MKHLLSNPLAADLDFVIDHAEPRLRSLAGERIFLTGGTGFFGRWLLETLTWANDRLALGLHVSVLSRDPAAFVGRAPHLTIHPALDWHRGDVRSFTQPSGSFSVVIHAATAASLPLSQAKPWSTFDIIVNGTQRVLEFADRCGCSAFLLTSSGAVYGQQSPCLEQIPEDYCGAPIPNHIASVYGEGKRSAELLCAASGLPAKVARGFTFVGPFLPMHRHFAVGNFIRDAMEGRAIVIKGDGTPCRSYLYASDLMVWLLAILLDGKANHPYNVGSDQQISIKELAEKISFLADGVAVTTQGNYVCDQTQRYVPSIARAKNELGLEVWTPLGKALERTMQFSKGRVNESK